jgi:hypothetical protein
MELSAFPRHSQPQSDHPMMTQAEKGRAFRAVHERDSAFIIPAAREMRDHGTFAFAEEAVSCRDISAMFTA